MQNKTKGRKEVINKINSFSDILVQQDYEKMDKIIEERVRKNDEDDLNMLLELMEENSEAMSILAV